LAEDCGLIREKYRVSLAKGPAKGCEPVSAVRLEFNGPDHKMREREAEGRGRRRRRRRPTGPSLPETAATELWGSVFQSETTGIERRARGTRSRPRSDQGEPARPAPWPTAENSSGERGRGAIGPHFARQKDRERVGEKGKLTCATRSCGNGSNGGTVRGGFTASSVSSYAVRTESGREGKWGGGMLGRAGLST